MSEIMEVRGVSFFYGGVKAVENVFFKVKRGEFVAILGPNGSGKTTLLKLLNGILSPSTGQVLLYSRELSTYKPVERSKIISYVPQNIFVDFPFTCEEIVLMGRYPYLCKWKIETEKDFEIAREAMAKTGVLSFSNRRINQISGGERQRVFIAQAIAGEPEIMMLDEPVSSLDIKYKIQILEILKDLRSKKEITVIITMHDLNLALRYTDRVLLIKNGKLFSSGSPKDVLNPKNIEDVYEVKAELTKDGYVIPTGLVKNLV